MVNTKSLVSRLSFALILTFAAFVATAAQDESEDANIDREVAAEGSRSRAAQNDKARYRRYPGGQDEQELKVQAVLPMPARSVDGQTTPGLPAASTADD